LIGAGLVVAQFLKTGFRAVALIAGIGLIAFGGATSFISKRQWQRDERALRQKQPLPRYRMPHILVRGVALFAVFAVVLAVLAFAAR
jgi:uncharacterized membrane protein YidH (DUF202 family)